MLDILSLVGLILPPFIDFINKNIANSKVKFVISLLVSLVVAVAVKFYEGKLTLDALGNVPALLTTAGVIFAEAQVVYKLLYHNSALERKIGA